MNDSRARSWAEKKKLQNMNGRMCEKKYSRALLLPEDWHLPATSPWSGIEVTYFLVKSRGYELPRQTKKRRSGALSKKRPARMSMGLRRLLKRRLRRQTKKPRSDTQ